MLSSPEVVPPADDRGLLRTGVAGLDRVFLGGFARGSAVLILGPPGSGKTTLGVQSLVNGARAFGENSLLVSFEEEPEQLFREAAAFNWPLREFVAQNRITILRIAPEDLHKSSEGQDSEAVRAIQRAQMKNDAQRILVDSIGHFFRSDGDTMKHRREFVDFLRSLREIGLSPILTGDESIAVQGYHGPAEYMADVVVHMHFDHAPATGEPCRWLEPLKARGQRFLEGRHPFKFAREGIEVFPHILPEPYTAGDDVASGRVCSTGVAGLDEMLGGGLLAGTTAIVAGMEGTAKSTMAAHFLRAGCEAGEPGLWLTFQEGPRQLLFSMESRGIPLARHRDAGTLRIEHLPPVGLCMLETFYRLRDMIEKHGLKRVVIDTLNEVRRNSRDDHEERYFMHLFCDLFRREGVTALLLEQNVHALGMETLAQIRHGALVDAIIFLGFTEFKGRLTKIVSVLKSRAGASKNEIREVLFTENGIEARQTLGGLTGILAGSPSMASTAAIGSALKGVGELLALAGGKESGEALSVAEAMALRGKLADFERDLQSGLGR